VHVATLILSALLLASIADARPDPGGCDRGWDGQVTVVDALQALQEAVDTCERGSYCDSDGDNHTTVSDALVLLRYAVGMPQVLYCSCIAIDECFEDIDCADRGQGWFCRNYLCTECDFAHPCGEGEFCSFCSLQCETIE
jgi:hypothetical protein